jgi:hypothetical protein
MGPGLGPWSFFNLTHGDAREVSRQRRCSPVERSSPAVRNHRENMRRKTRERKREARGAHVQVSSSSMLLEICTVHVYLVVYDL